MDGHVKAVGIIYLVLGCLGALGGLVMLVIFGGIAGAGVASGDADAEAAAGFMGLLGGFLFVMVLIFSLPAILAGWGVLKRKSWARILTIILAVLNLLNIPIGTIIGAYSLWVMLNKDVAPMFGGAVAPAGGAPRI